MSQSLSGSRYELHIAKKWAAETKSQDYYTIHQAISRRPTTPGKTWSATCTPGKWAARSTARASAS